MLYFLGLFQLISGLINIAEEILQHRMAEQEIAPKLKARLGQRDRTIFSNLTSPLLRKFPAIFEADEGRT